MIRVLIVDNSRLACNLISDVLRNEDDIRVVASTMKIDEALLQVWSGDCDVVLVNAALPDQGALQIVQKVVQLGLPAKVLVTNLPELPEIILQYIEAGAAGYVLKSASAEDMLEHIRLIHQNAALVSPQVAAALIDRVVELASYHGEASKQWSSQVSLLTQRERQILELMRGGLSNPEIAEQLTIGLGTVKNHVHNILRKLDVSSRREAVAHVVALETAELEERDIARSRF